MSPRSHYAREARFAAGGDGTTARDRGKYDSSGRVSARGQPASAPWTLHGVESRLGRLTPGMGAALPRMTAVRVAAISQGGKDA